MQSDKRRVSLTVAEAAYLASACLEDEIRGTQAASVQDVLYRFSIAFRPETAPIRERVVHKAIEEAVVESSREVGAVTVGEEAVLYILSQRRLHQLTLSQDAKSRLYKAVASLGGEPEPGWSVELDKDVHYVLGRSLRRWSSVLQAYATDRDEHVVSDPEIMGGTPVIRGTRIPVYSVLGRVDGGDSIDDLIEDYPHVPQRAFEAAVAYARAHPRRGRPKQFR